MWNTGSIFLPTNGFNFYVLCTNSLYILWNFKRVWFRLISDSEGTECKKKNRKQSLNHSKTSMWLAHVTQFEIPIPWISNRTNQEMHQKGLICTVLQLFRVVWWRGGCCTGGPRQNSGTLLSGVRRWIFFFGEQKDRLEIILVGMTFCWSRGVTGVVPRYQAIRKRSKLQRTGTEVHELSWDMKVGQKYKVRRCCRHRRSQARAASIEVAGSLVASFTFTFFYIFGICILAYGMSNGTSRYTLPLVPTMSIIYPPTSIFTQSCHVESWFGIASVYIKSDSSSHSRLS